MDKIYIDFDRTISPVHGFHVCPTDETIAAINKLSEKYEIIIFSCRANNQICTENEYELMVKYLELHSIPYYGIYFGKPLYHAIIDDRAYNPLRESWTSILKELL